ALLEPVLHGLDVVVGLALDRLDARGVLRREAGSRVGKRVERCGRKRGNFGDRRLCGERREPRDLDAHAMADQAEFAELLAQRGDLAGVAPVERRQRGESGEFSGGHCEILACASPATASRGGVHATSRCYNFRSKSRASIPALKLIFSPVSPYARK